MNRKSKNDLLFLADAEIKHVHMELGINDLNDFNPKNLLFSVAECGAAEETCHVCRGHRYSVFRTPPLCNFPGETCDQKVEIKACYAFMVPVILANYIIYHIIYFDDDCAVKVELCGSASVDISHTFSHVFNDITIFLISLHFHYSW